ncbi:putative DBH-like monooxygenase protein 2 [Pantherophis guttatus]|uniref:DBH-like monooxygenase protein 2 n=1 Tax=Pantherophis guttatus TaxID=94885 RepID=A0A6P9B6C0_PANGU|nr:putative DBH-like monooxygenase protein 2 [Pantherophis guttatus]
MRDNKKAQYTPNMNHSSMKSLLLLMSTLCLCSSHPAISQLRFSVFLDPKHQIYLRWDYDDELAFMSFEFQAQSTGWVAFGFTNNKDIPGADFVIGGVLPDGNIYFSDWHGVNEDTILEDERQDYELLSLTQDATSTTMAFRRQFRTCDEHDLDITGDTQRLMAAFGTNDTIDFFKGKIIHKSLFLMLVVTEEKLKRPSVYHIYDLKVNDFPIPEDDTTYACTFLPLPIVKTKHHIYKFSPMITPRNITLVHHIIAYACGNGSVLPSGVSDCYGGDPDFSLCSQIIAGWAVGGGSYMFPDETGISIGTPIDPQWIRLEIHYSNFDFLPGLIDNSGLRMFYTSELRPYDMGVLHTGVLTFPIHFIPPQADSFKSYGFCNTSHFHEINGSPVPDMHVFGYLLHTHLAGRGVRGIQYRNGKQLRILCEDNKYDFNLQETRDLMKPVVLKPGDEFLVECRYQTTDRKEIIFGGPSTLNEMCLIFLFYYPRNNISNCLGLPDIQYVANQLGQEANDQAEGMMAINAVQWNNETIKKAENACKEGPQIVTIKTIDEVVVNETGFIRDIDIPEPAPCKLSPRDATTTRQPEGHTKYKAIPDVVSKAVGTS